MGFSGIASGYHHTLERTGLYGQLIRLSMWTATQGVQKSFKALIHGTAIPIMQTCLNEPIGCLEVALLIEHG